MSARLHTRDSHRRLPAGGPLHRREMERDGDTD